MAGLFGWRSADTDFNILEAVTLPVLGSDSNNSVHAVLSVLRFQSGLPTSGLSLRYRKLVQFIIAIFLCISWETRVIFKAHIDEINMRPNLFHKLKVCKLKEWTKLGTIDTVSINRRKGFTFYKSRCTFVLFYEQSIGMMTNIKVLK